MPSFLIRKLFVRCDTEKVCCEGLHGAGLALLSPEGEGAELLWGETTPLAGEGEPLDLGQGPRQLKVGLTASFAALILKMFRAGEKPTMTKINSNMTISWAKADFFLIPF